MYKQSHLISYLYDKFYKEFDEYSNVTSSITPQQIKTTI